MAPSRALVLSEAGAASGAVMAQHPTSYLSGYANNMIDGVGEGLPLEAAVDVPAASAHTCDARAGCARSAGVHAAPSDAASCAMPSGVG